MKQINYALAIYSIIVCLVLLLYLLLGERKHKQSNQCFAMMCGGNIGMMLGDILYWSFEGQKTFWNPAMVWIGSSLFYISVIPVLYAFTKYIIDYLRLHKKAAKPLLMLSNGFIGVYIIACLLSLWNGMFFMIDENNYYLRGNLFVLSQIIPLVIFLSNIGYIYTFRKTMRKKDLTFFASYILLLFLAKLIEFIVNGLIVLNMAMAISLLLIFINIQLERDIGMERKEKELTDANISILLSQIGPHFLSNTLTAIRQLCDKDVEEAKATITDFSRFLRGNMSILTSKNMIPFEKELSHTKYYLAIERKRFGERLQIHYDIAETNFLIPPLTIQPIVENAVRYGLTKKVEGGNLYIQTLLRGDYVVIRILDDGAGFPLSYLQNDTESHIGIHNVRKRLAYMCEGTLEIKSHINQGTIVEICIPREVSHL